MFDFDFFSLFLALAGISTGIALLAHVLVANDDMQVTCRDA